MVRPPAAMDDMLYGSSDSVSRGMFYRFIMHLITANSWVRKFGKGSIKENRYTGLTACLRDRPNFRNNWHFLIRFI